MPARNASSWRQQSCGKSSSINEERKQPCRNRDYCLVLGEAKAPLDLISAKQRGAGPEGEGRRQTLGQGS